MLIYYFIHTIVIIIFKIACSSQNDSNLEVNSFQRPLHFQEAVKYVNQNLKFKNEFVNYELLVNLKAHFAHLLNNIENENLLKKMFIMNITKSCFEKIDFFLQELKLKKDWSLKGY